MPGPMLNDRDLLRHACFVDGHWSDDWTGETIDVSDPATGTVLGTVPSMAQAETREAVAAARRAFTGWAGALAQTRADALRSWADLMIAHRDDLARILTLEQGKSLAEAGGEITYAASFLTWFSEEAKRVYGDTIPPHQQDRRLITLKQPVGVVGAITPWNFPAAMIARKAAAALAAGCTMVVKPASQTPFSALAMAVLAERAGVPAGVFNVITGNAQAIGDELTSNPDVAKITFTGSTQTGRLLLEKSAAGIKKVSMELGGNAPFIVFGDADIDAAVDGAVVSKYRNSGQTCVCTNRFYIHHSVYGEFADKFTRKVQSLRVGNGLDEGVDQGPLIDLHAVEKVEEHIADALEKGAQLKSGGRRHELGRTFFEPTILTDASQDMLIARDETFGPVSALISFEDEEEAVGMANSTEFGLAAYFYSRDIGRIWRVAERLESGMIGINTGLVSTAAAPFGGVKQSGLGREGSKYGLDDYLEIKYLCMAF